MGYLEEKSNHLKPLIKKAFNENSETTRNFNLLCGYIWRYEGADENMLFEDFFIGLLENRFSNQNIISKIDRSVKLEMFKKNEQF